MFLCEEAITNLQSPTNFSTSVAAFLHLHPNLFLSLEKMGFSPILILIIFIANVFEISECATVIFDGVSEWKNPQVQIGDSVIFQHKYNYSVYIFKNQKAFSLCNFTQATILTNPNSSVYTWHTSRTGFFYFSFYNGSNKPCLQGQKLAVKVTLAEASSPELPPQVSAPPQSSGGYVASSPAFPWPFQPRENNSPSPAPVGATSPAAAAAAGKEGIPFINSNPAVPLPTGEVDSATIRPLPTSGYQQVVGVSGVQKALSCVILVIMMV